MKKIFLLIIILSLSLLISCSPATSPAFTPSEGEGEEEPTGDRVVLVELFNTDGCSASALINPIMEDLAQQYGTNQVILLEEAGWGKYSTPETMERFDWYVPGDKHTPFIAFNGLSETFSEGIVGGGGGGGYTPPPVPPAPEPEIEVIFVTDINPENDLILVAGIEGGEKIVTLGEKDASGNPISITGALYLTGQGEGLAIEVGVDGLPAKIVDSDGNKFTFENYTDSTVDISIYDFEENLIEGPITIEIDPDDISRMQQLYQSFSSKSRWDAHNTADIFEYTSVAIGFVGCGASIFGAIFTGGFTIPVAAIACSSAVYNAYTVSHPNEPILTNTEGTTLNVTDNILNVVFSNKFTPWGIAGTISGMIGSAIEAGATKMDIIEVHNEFLLAIVNQDWFEAKSLCIEGSEAYNMIWGVEIAFANESLNPDNSIIEISQRIDDLSITDRPIAHMYNTAVITITAEGYDPFAYSGEWYYGYLEEVSLNKWKKVESAILKITGVPPSGPLPNPTLYDPGDTVDSFVEYTVSWSDESEHGAIDYFIKEDTSPDFDPNSPNYSGSWVDGTSKTFSHQVDQDTTYYYRVWSYAGNTVWSEPGSNIESITVKKYNEGDSLDIYDLQDSVNSSTPYTVRWYPSDDPNHIYYVVLESTGYNPPFLVNPTYYYNIYDTSKVFTHSVNEDTTYYYQIGDYCGGPGFGLGDIDSIIVKKENSGSLVHNLTKDTYYNTIQAALDDADNDNTIEVADGIYDESIYFPSGKKIILQSVNGASSTTIRGNANSETVRLYSSPDGTKLEGFTITHKTGESGGGIEVSYSSNIIIGNCTISNNENSTGDTSGIFNHASTLTIAGSTISGNNGCGIGNSGILTITGSTISGNTDRGIYNTGTLTITGGTIISGNTTNGCGGGILNAYNNGILTITGSTISSNTASGWGGGIYSNGILTITGSIISGNNADNNGGGILLEVDSTTMNIGGSSSIDTDNFNTFTDNYKTGNAPSPDQHIRWDYKDCHEDYPYNYFNPDNNGTYALRDIGPAGGYIFYDKGSYSDGWRYLEAAPVSTEWYGKQWGSYGTMIGGTETGIGTGQANTTSIVTWLNSHSETDRAAQLCDALVYGGYSDWFFPSRGELNLMYENLKLFGVGGFANGYYWSSSEDSADRAGSQNLYDGNQYYHAKYGTARVRAVRAF